MDLSGSDLVPTNNLDVKVGPIILNLYKSSAIYGSLQSKFNASLREI